MAKQVGDSPTQEARIIGPDDFKRFVSRENAAKKTVADAQDALKTLYDKAAAEKNLHKKAAKEAIKINKMGPAELTEYWFHLMNYCDYLEIPRRAQEDMLVDRQAAEEGLSEEEKAERRQKSRAALQFVIKDGDEQIARTKEKLES